MSGCVVLVDIYYLQSYGITSHWAKYVNILLTIELEDRPLILNWEKNPGRTPYNVESTY